MYKRQAINEARAKANSSWIITAGDWNRYDTSSVTKAFPDIQKRKTIATRKDALLDYSFTNFESDINLSEVCFPIESNIATKSDHNLVCYECILERSATFAWQMHEYVKITEEGTARFNGLLAKQDWRGVQENIS